MRPFYYLWVFMLLIMCSASTCDQPEDIAVCSPAPIEIINVDTLAYSSTDRNDVPPPPDKEWRDIDTSTFDECQKKVWYYLEQMYPINEPNAHNYFIYGLKNEPDEHFARWDYYAQFVYFFTDTLTRSYLYQAELDCQKLDTTFFLQTIGAPTFKTYNTLDVNYFYHYKVRYRNGPCPNIFDIESPYYTGRFNSSYFDPCGMLKVNFKKSDGQLFHALGAW